jgi:hypothetical protein
MPTKHHRTFVTHTPQVTRALEVARTRWPNERESALLLHLLEEGAKAVETSSRLAREERLSRLRQLSRHSDLYGEGYLDDVRDGWPE